MDFDAYKAEALKTEWTGRLDQNFGYDKEFFDIAFSLFITASKLVDLVKKRLIYDRPIHQADIQKISLDALKLLSRFSEYEMGRKEYTSDGKFYPSDVRIIHALLTIASESGELVEAFLNFNTKEDLLLEIGDLEWGRCLLFDSLHVSPEKVWAKNIAKIRARFGDSFSTEKANNRNLEKEKLAVMEID